MLKIADTTFTSRLFTGTGKFATPALMLEALAASGSQLVTMAMKRVDLRGGNDAILAPLQQLGVRLLPNTSGAKTAAEAVFAALGKHWDGLDIIVHSVGFAPGDQLDGDFTAVTTREGFRIAHDISAYSFIALAKAGREMMKGRNGSLLTLSYLGAERTMPNYNVMDMAKASLEAGVRYLAGSLGDGYQRLHDAGIDAAFSLAPGPISLEQACAGAAAELEARAEQIARLWRLAQASREG
ncbi:MAG: SDR family oxidoreductase [Serratia marcescens]|nr:SDR family oxidoreductase [Serratia marcescens]